MGLMDAINAAAIVTLKKRISVLENIQGGQGVTVHRTPGGIAIHVKPSKVRPGGKGQSEVKGDAKVLNFTLGNQDTDTYDRATDKVPVEFQVITDVSYSTDTHALTIRTRTVTATGITAVSAESDAQDVFVAEACP